MKSKEKSNDSLNVLMVVDAFYPQDIRVRKEAESLAEFGVNITVCSVNDGKQADDEVIKGVQVRRMKPISYSKKGLLDIFVSVFKYHPVFLKFLTKYLKKNQYDIIHIHDLPLAPTCLKLGKKFSIETILDLHENYPEAFSSWFEWRRSKLIKLKNKLFFNPKRWRKIEKKMCLCVDKIIVVVDEMGGRLTRKYNINSDKIHVVSNSEKKDFKKNYENTTPLDFVEKNEDKFLITYIGGFGPHRGLDTVIRAMPMVKEKIPNALFLMIGSGNSDVKAKLNNYIEELAIADHVVIHDKIPFSQVCGAMLASDINVVPHNKNDHTNNTIPHKVFQILMTKRPLLVSDCIPLKRVVDTIKGGIVFDAGDPLSCAKKIIEIHDNYESSLVLAMNGFNAIEEGAYNWEDDAKSLLTCYQN